MTIESAEAPQIDLERRKAVLVVEDELAIREFVSEILTDAGCRVLQAANGLEAIALLHSDEWIDLLITDITLSGEIDGHQVTKAGRLQRPDLNVLFVTGALDEVWDGRIDGRTAVLTKPFQTSALEFWVNGMLGI